MKTLKIYDHSSDHGGEKEAPTCGAHPSRYDASLTVPPPFFVSLYAPSTSIVLHGPLSHVVAPDLIALFPRRLSFHGFILLFYLSLFFSLSSLFSLMWLSWGKDNEIKAKARQICWATSLSGVLPMQHVNQHLFFLLPLQRSHLITLFLVDSFPTVSSKVDQQRKFTLKVQNRMT